VKYILKNDFKINVGFDVTADYVIESIQLTNKMLHDLPSTLYRSIDYKTTSAIVGAVFCDRMASKADCIVNPIEKGHPDLIGKEGADCTEEELRNYLDGLEIKATVGNIEKGANLRAGESRIEKLEGITWQAHHREVKKLLGLVWDFVSCGHVFNYPVVTGVFCATDLVVEDWGKISGTEGRNTKVSGMRSSGKAKMGTGWVVLIAIDKYVEAYSKILGFKRSDLSQIPPV